MWKSAGIIFGDFGVFFWRAHPADKGRYTRKVWQGWMGWGEGNIYTRIERGYVLLLFDEHDNIYLIKP